jgi:hypothetical protein
MTVTLLDIVSRPSAGCWTSCHDLLRLAAGHHCVTTFGGYVRLTTGHQTHSTARKNIIFRYRPGEIVKAPDAVSCPGRCDERLYGSAYRTRYREPNAKDARDTECPDRIVFLPIESCCSSLSLTILKLHTKSNDLLLFQQTKRSNTQR